MASIKKLSCIEAAIKFTKKMEDVEISKGAGKRKKLQTERTLTYPLDKRFDYIHYILGI